LSAALSISPAFLNFFIVGQLVKHNVTHSKFSTVDVAVQPNNFYRACHSLMELSTLRYV